ncbi:MAG: VCBS repeat-containing protein [Pyrinomonadaceae bacterium]
MGFMKKSLTSGALLLVKMCLIGLLTMWNGAAMAASQETGETTPGTDPVVTSDNKSAAFDYDGDGATDIAVWRPDEANWYILPSGNGKIIVRRLGKEGDRPVPADYDGDGRTDLATYRPSEGTWHILTRDGLTVEQFGISGDRPVPADYDGDGRTDLAVFRPGDGTWRILESGNPNRAPEVVHQWGAKGDIPVPGDYDGDGFANIAIFRPTEATWYVLNRDGSYTGQQWGNEGDKPVPADYDGDNKTDIAVFRDIPQAFRTDAGTTWHILGSRDGSSGAQWGSTSDRPVPGDYDGDRRTDFAVFRPNGGNWFITETSSRLGVTKQVQFGKSGDVPVSSGYIVD